MLHPTGVNLNLYAGKGSFVPWHCDDELLFGEPSDPKVIAVSMSLGHSVQFKLRFRVTVNSPSQIRLDYGDLLVIDGLTQFEYEHPTSSERSCPRVNLTFRWLSQHIRSCPEAGFIGCTLPSGAQDLAEPHYCVGGGGGVGRGNGHSHDLFNGPPGGTREHAFCGRMYLIRMREYVAEITIVGLFQDADHIKLGRARWNGH